METDFQRNAYVNLGKFYRSLSDFGLKAIEFHQQALRIAKEIENKYSEGDTCGALSNTCHSLGNFKRAVKFHRQAHSIAKEIGAKDLEARAHGNLGVVYNFRGDFERAIELYQQYLSIAREIQTMFHKDLYIAAFFEKMRFLLQEKDEWKVSFRDRCKACSLLWSSIATKLNFEREVSFTAAWKE